MRYTILFLVVFLVGNRVSESMQQNERSQSGSGSSSGIKYIVIGAGSTASPLASELSKAGYKTLICEAGPKKSQLPLSHLVDNLDNNKWVKYEPIGEITYRSVPQKRALTNGTVYYEDEELRRYEGEGGCNYHNAGWGRHGVKKIYDTFPREWRSEDWEPYLNRAFSDMNSDIPSNNITLQEKIMEEWSIAFNTTIVEDCNLYENTELGVQKSIFNYIEKEIVKPNGSKSTYYQRHASFDAYVAKSKKLNKTLFVSANTRVERLLFKVENKNCNPRRDHRCEKLRDAKFGDRPQDMITKGVEVTDMLTGIKRNITADIEVVVSGGTWKDPLLFMRSGIGNCTTLRALGITCLIDEPRIGAKFYYHMVLASLMGVNPEFAVIGNNSQFNTQVGLAISTENKNYPDAIIDFQMETNPTFLPSPPLPRPVGFGIILSMKDFGPGTISMDPTDHHRPIVDLKLFQNSWEIPHLMEIFKVYRKMLHTSSVYEYEIVPGLPLDSEDSLRDYVVANVEDGAHPVGSFPIDELVDKKLRYIGPQRLRVADLSVVPRGNHANPNMMAIALGLKASRLILRDAKRLDRECL